MDASALGSGFHHNLGLFPEAGPSGLLHEMSPWTGMLHKQFKFWTRMYCTSHNERISHYIISSFSPAHQYDESSFLEMKNGSINHWVSGLLPKAEVPLKHPHHSVMGWQCLAYLFLDIYGPAAWLASHFPEPHTTVPTELSHQLLLRPIGPLTIASSNFGFSVPYSLQIFSVAYYFFSLKLNTEE